MTLVFFLALLATLSYSLQSTLMVRHYRSLPTFWVVGIRGLSLGLTMLPLLAFVPLNEWPRMAGAWPYILGASVMGVAAMFCNVNAMRRLPASITGATGMSTAALVVVLSGNVFFGEPLPANAQMVIPLILIAVITLGIIKTPGNLPDAHHIAHGLPFAMMFGILLGVGYILVGLGSRHAHPFAVGYFWELGIGLLAMAIAITGQPLTTPQKQALNRSRVQQIALNASPTALGTGLFALAMSIGPVALASAVNGTNMVFTTLFARKMYGEKLHKRQWVLLGVIVVLVIALRLSWH
jgi:drug/metabolite transporter (DMT)-like permease